VKTAKLLVDEGKGRIGGFEEQGIVVPTDCTVEVGEFLGSKLLDTFRFKLSHLSIVSEKSHF
jgi:hypothetical protein